jgi:hypothetical protein
VVTCFFISLCPAPSIDAAGGKSASACLSASEFPRAPADTATRRIKRGTGFFFWILFLAHKKSNEALSIRIASLAGKHRRQLYSASVSRLGIMPGKPGKKIDSDTDSGFDPAIQKR